MDPTVRQVATTERLTAVVAASTTWGEFPALWRSLLDEVYAFVNAGGAEQTGHNVMLYLDDVPHVEVGVEVRLGFDPSGRVTPSVLPAGLTAMTLHRGPYGDLDKAHTAIHRWCAETGRQPAGPRWEIYGDWRDDPAELETEVYYLLRGGSVRRAPEHRGGIREPEEPDRG